MRKLETPQRVKKTTGFRLSSLIIRHAALLRTGFQYFLTKACEERQAEQTSTQRYCPGLRKSFSIQALALRGFSTKFGATRCSASDSPHWS